ncbi:hypothetical protein VHUM_00552 [Vanrija humicola]|uniref:tRNA (guanine(10)-N(2))-methyltransferase n=1 Tax=Vanrija humicola TaxID=5417 RepID=A0A7D8V5Z2_VANHU|nr:hypothetical protein VHUM_00552 [Vanrija humicola]
MPQYFLRLSLEHLSFRIPELLSIAQLFGFELKFVSEDLSRGVVVIEVEKEEHVERILDRGILVISANRLYAQGATYDELHAQLRDRLDLFEPDLDVTFKMVVDGVNNRALDRRARAVINSFAYTGLRGKIDLTNPEVEFVALEDYDLVTLHTHEARLVRDGNFRQVYFGRRVGVSRARPLFNVMDVKQRTFYGNTTMEAEMGLLVAGQALPAPGKIIYDPFVGTGSLLYSVAIWGAYVVGSDIDARQFRGKAKGKGITPGILRSAEQYGVRDKFLDNVNFDVTQGPWRRGGWMDAIVTDPPYGVRAGAKRIGRSETRKRNVLRDEAYVMPDGSLAHQKESYLPPFKPYELVDLTLDLIHLARYLLVKGGRLVFFLPTVTEDFDHVDVPIVDGMQELKWGDGSVQDFGKWGRRLITMVKTTDECPLPTFTNHVEELTADRLPGHHDFAKRVSERIGPQLTTVPRGLQVARRVRERRGAGCGECAGAVGVGRDRALVRPIVYIDMHAACCAFESGGVSWQPSRTPSTHFSATRDDPDPRWAWYKSGVGASQQPHPHPCPSRLPTSPPPPSP